MSIDKPARAAAAELISVLLERHSKYGPLNISGSPGGPLNGLRVRLYDKLARVNNYVDGNAQADFADDKLRDAFIDMAGYALIGLLVLDGDWPTSLETKPPPADHYDGHMTQAWDHLVSAIQSIDYLPDPRVGQTHVKWETA